MNFLYPFLILSIISISRSFCASSFNETDDFPSVMIDFDLIKEGRFISSKFQSQFIGYLTEYVSRTNQFKEFENFSKFNKRKSSRITNKLEESIFEILITLKDFFNPLYFNLYSKKLRASNSFLFHRLFKPKFDKNEILQITAEEIPKMLREVKLVFEYLNALNLYLSFSENVSNLIGIVLEINSFLKIKMMDSTKEISIFLVEDDSSNLDILGCFNSQVKVESPGAPSNAFQNRLIKYCGKSNFAKYFDALFNSSPDVYSSLDDEYRKCYSFAPLIWIWQFLPAKLNPSGASESFLRNKSTYQYCHFTLSSILFLRMIRLCSTSKCSTKQVNGIKESLNDCNDIDYSSQLFIFSLGIRFKNFITFMNFPMALVQFPLAKSILYKGIIGQMLHIDHFHRVAFVDSFKVPLIDVLNGHASSIGHGSLPHCFKLILSANEFKIFSIAIITDFFNIIDTSHNSLNNAKDSPSTIYYPQALELASIYLERVPEAINEIQALNAWITFASSFLRLNFLPPRANPDYFLEIKSMAQYFASIMQELVVHSCPPPPDMLSSGLWLFTYFSDMITDLSDSQTKELVMLRSFIVTFQSNI